MKAISDWNDEYDNVGHIPQALSFVSHWQAVAQDYRQNNTSTVQVELDVSYGPKDRNAFDLFVPKDASTGSTRKPKGLFVFVHGGYWYRFEKSIFSHLAQGPVDKGYAVAIPSYTLCPDVKVSDITNEITCSILAAAERVPDGPIVLCGHSAGGHLVSRQLCQDVDTKGLSARLTRVISISGVHDLRPVLNIVQNETIRLDPDEAQKESPALLTPQLSLHHVVVDCIVGAEERPEFVRQNDLLANIWRGMGMATRSVHLPGKHHFDVIDDLVNPHGLICGSL